MFLYKTYAFEDKTTIVFKDPHIQTGLSDSSGIAKSVFVALNTPKSPIFIIWLFVRHNIINGSSSESVDKTKL